MNRLKGIDLADSFVLSWSVDDTFSIVIEASVWPESKFYFKPPNGEYTCYRKAILIFSGFSQCVGVREMSSCIATRDLDGSLDYGNIDSFKKTDNGYEISGDFGDIVVLGGDFSLTYLQITSP
ncbi:hypothetical protein [Cognaticolwellia aestuarii]|uniref:hypothetical protein n=1 Tax=Cognaticolwellia aestuarii TaxID=329993 RepID=UPI000984300A|nr:hypothetical protein [Cognaticolwellia aestuarii]